MKNRTRSYNPCYKLKIQYHQNRINNLVNCAPCQISPESLLKHLNSLNHFVKLQADIQVAQKLHSEPSKY